MNTFEAISDRVWFNGFGISAKYKKCSANLRTAFVFNDSHPHHSRSRLRRIPRPEEA